MTIAYISGKYRARTVIGRLINIWKARRVALRYWRKGYAVICPHSNTAMFDGKCDDSVWLKGDIEIIKRLDPKRDVIIMMRGWEDSDGARHEYYAALSCGLRVIFDKGE